MGLYDSCEDCDHECREECLQCKGDIDYDRMIDDRMESDK